MAALDVPPNPPLPLATYLFRSEVVQARRSASDFAPPLQAPPRSQRLVMCLLLLGVVVGALWLVQQDYTQKLTATGFTQSGKGETRVYPPRVAIVDGVFVEEGQWVTAGTPLLELRVQHYLDSQSSKDTRDRELLTQELHELGVQQELLAAEQATIAQSLSLQITQVTRAQPLLQARRRALTERIELKDAQQIGLKTLHKRGGVSRTQLDAVLAQRLLLLNERSQLDQERGELSLRLLQLSAQQSSQVAQTKLRLSALRTQRLQLARALNSLDASIRETVLAPVAGQVSSLQVVAGRRVVPTRPLLSLNPQSVPAQVVLLLPSTTATQVQPGQRVNLRYAGLPLQETALQQGEILDVSTTPVHPGELEIPIKFAGPAFVAQVALRTALPDHLRLLPGVLVQADVSLQTAPLWRWLLQPFQGAWQRL